MSELCFCGSPKRYYKTTGRYSKVCDIHKGKASCEKCGCVIWAGGKLCLKCKNGEDSFVVCKHCGKEFKYRKKKNNSNQFCSRECGFRGQTHRNHDNSKDGKHSKIYFVECAVCKKPFTSNHKGSKICSDDCAKKVKVAKAFAFNSAKKDISPKTCKHCGREFIAEYGSKLRVYCSKDCLTTHSRKITKAKRSARIRGAGTWENVDPFIVFARDGWKCKICGVPTPKHKRGLNFDDSPELDHIVPVSKNGYHTYDNTQCLCRRCNSEKSDTL